MNHSILFIIIAIVAGVILPIQAGINSNLSKALQNPITGSLASFIIGTISIFLYAVFTKSLSHFQFIKNTNLIDWTGGIMGAFYVTSLIYLIPRLGSALSFSLILAGQMTMTLVIDHFGMMNTGVHPINAYRILGLTLIIAGVIIIRKF
ncbi:MAG: hypothetical protein RIQ89_927 [Bacteroidota bacterium]|jgi:bacterial/archaeal transporter family-2 protein